MSDQNSVNRFRLVLAGSVLQSSYVDGSAEPFRFDDEYDLTEEQVYTHSVSSKLFRGNKQGHQYANHQALTTIWYNPGEYVAIRKGSYFFQTFKLEQHTWGISLQTIEPMRPLGSTRENMWPPESNWRRTGCGHCCQWPSFPAKVVVFSLIKEPFPTCSNNWVRIAKIFLQEAENVRKPCFTSGWLATCSFQTLEVSDHVPVLLEMNWCRIRFKNEPNCILIHNKVFLFTWSYFAKKRHCFRASSSKSFDVFDIFFSSSSFLSSTTQ